MEQSGRGRKSGTFGLCSLDLPRSWEANSDSSIWAGCSLGPIDRPLAVMKTNRHCREELWVQDVVGPFDEARKRHRVDFHNRLFH
ncbi:hypothetical protein BDK89_1992 [Ilumatobacter fluminis]|uniref:Uncharacterized protein n=1 Tax=Ilumatobacter fluminis TaxID=467091 RepID=A0A4R7I1M8_9ACTN|nr:hypothetical protein BDK89_1992 [Ilumatobacter fluminis]